MAKKKLQLYVWEGFNPYYTSVLTFAIAKDEAQARKIVEENLSYDPSTWGVLSIHPLNEVFGRAVSGG